MIAVVVERSDAYQAGRSGGRRGFDGHGRGAAGSPAPYTALSWMGPYLGGNLGYQWGAPDKGNADPAGTIRRRASPLWLAGRPIHVRRGNRPTVLQRGRYLRQLQVLEPLVRNAAWPRRIRPQQHSVLRHAGLAYGRGQAGATENNLHTGLAAGFGLEGGLTQNWPAKAGYLYIDFGGASDDLIGTSNG